MDPWEREKLQRDLVDLANGLQVALERLWNESRDDHDRAYILAQARRAASIRQRYQDELIGRGIRHDVADV